MTKFLGFYNHTGDIFAAWEKGERHSKYLRFNCSGYDITCYSIIYSNIGAHDCMNLQYFNNSEKLTIVQVKELSINLISALLLAGYTKKELSL